MALYPDELANRKAELRHKRREVWTNDDNWELALKQQEIRFDRTERERAVQRERARVSDLKHAPRRLAEQKAKNQLIKLGVTLPAKPPRIPHSGNVESWPTFYRDLLEKTEKEKAEARKKKKALKAKRAALRRRMECEYCGSDGHEFSGAFEGGGMPQSWQCIERSRVGLIFEFWHYTSYQTPRRISWLLYGPYH